MAIAQPDVGSRWLLRNKGFEQGARFLITFGKAIGAGQQVTRIRMAWRRSQRLLYDPNRSRRLATVELKLSQAQKFHKMSRIVGKRLLVIGFGFAQIALDQIYACNG